MLEGGAGLHCSNIDEMRHDQRDCALGAHMTEMAGNGKRGSVMDRLSNHARRVELSDEVHARPPERLSPPARLSYLAMLNDASTNTVACDCVRQLATQFGVRPPEPGENHFSADFGDFRLKWERHGEFARFMFIVHGQESQPFAEPASNSIPADWLRTLPGEVLVAAHLVIEKADEAIFDHEDLSARYFRGNPLVGSRVASGAGLAVTDFRIHEDGFSRFLIQDISLTPRQAGRTVQRLLEMETYRMLALLALPIARELAPFLVDSERELVSITAQMIDADRLSEGELLLRLTRLAAGIESRYADSLFRFSAAVAYEDLVTRRISELREERFATLQTYREFMDRRFTPAMSTCRSTRARQDALSIRLSRATQLMSTQVDVFLEQQNQAILAAMNRRGRLQLRLQQTVEGLSIAAVTYYAVGLIGYAAKAAHAGGFPINPEIKMGVSVPLVAGLTALAVRRVHRLVAEHE
jgi:uncharacterized membrane-anchored protein